MARGRIACRRALAVALAGAALVLLALLFDAAPLFVVGVGCVLLGLAAPIWVWCLTRGVALERRLEQERVIEGEPLEAMIEVRGWLPGGEIADPLLSGAVPLPRGRRAAVRVLARFERRGPYHLEPPSLIVRDPFALAEGRRLSGGTPADVLVLPRTERVRWIHSGNGTAEFAGRPTGAALLAAVEVDGLRPYRPGTPASRIHWPALARGAGLLERRLRVDGDRTPLVVLDSRGSTSDTDLDAAVRAAASLTLELAQRGGCRLLLPGERRPLIVESNLTAWPAAHARLAVVKGGQEPRAPALNGIRAALGPLFYVAARRVDRIEAVLGRDLFAGGAATLVVPAGGGRHVGPSFTVAGCVGFAVRVGRREPAERAA